MLCGQRKTNQVVEVNDYDGSLEQIRFNMFATKIARIVDGWHVRIVLVICSNRTGSKSRESLVQSSSG